MTKFENLSRKYFKEVMGKEEQSDATYRSAMVKQILKSLIFPVIGQKRPEKILLEGLGMSLAARIVEQNDEKR